MSIFGRGVISFVLLRILLILEKVTQIKVKKLFKKIGVFDLVKSLVIELKA